MSYILDALKKSEREKTLGQVPTLESVVSDGAKKQRSGTPLWLNLVVFFVALIAVVGILNMAGLLDFSKSENSASQQTQQFEASISDVNTGGSAGQAVVADPAAQSSTQTDQNAVASITPEQSTANAEQVQDTQPSSDSVDAVQPTEIDAEAQLPEVLPDDAQQTIADENIFELEEKLAAQEAEELAALAQELEPQKLKLQQQSNEANSNNANIEQPQYEEVIHDGLRDISVNVVSYSSDSRQRFVMLDLTIYKEGDQLANNAQVIEIIRTGAIVEFQNKRYLLKP